MRTQRSHVAEPGFHQALWPCLSLQYPCGAGHPILGLGFSQPWDWGTGAGRIWAPWGPPEGVAGFPGQRDKQGRRPGICIRPTSGNVSRSLSNHCAVPRQGPACVCARAYVLPDEVGRPEGGQEAGEGPSGPPDLAESCVGHSVPRALHQLKSVSER